MFHGRLMIPVLGLSPGPRDRVASHAVLHQDDPSVRDAGPGPSHPSPGNRILRRSRRASARSPGEAGADLTDLTRMAGWTTRSMGPPAGKIFRLMASFASMKHSRRIR